MSEVKVVDAKSHKPFVMPEKLASFVVTKDPSAIEGLPKQYVPRWVNKKKLPGNRVGIWVVVDKTHPEFKDLKVGRDDTPEATMFTWGDLILCVTHKDTYKQLVKKQSNRAKGAIEKFDQQDEANLERIRKEGVKSLNTILKDVETKEE